MTRTRLTGRSQIVLTHAMRPTDRTGFAKKLARRFPVKVRIRVPDGGMITCGPDLYPWLDRHCGGRQAWTFLSSYDETRPVDSTVLCVADIAVASAFLEHFGLETIEIIGERQPPDREALLHLHGIKGGNRTRRAEE